MLGICFSVVSVDTARHSTARSTSVAVHALRISAILALHDCANCALHDCAMSAVQAWYCVTLLQFSYLYATSPTTYVCS